MKILGIDTSTHRMSVGLYMNGLCQAELNVQRSSRHAELLTESIDLVLKRSGLEAGDLDGIAVALGPGSFTGLRIGLGTAKGIAFGCDCPVVGVPTMESYVNRVPTAYRQCCVALVSRKNEYFIQYFDRADGCWAARNDVSLASTENVFTGMKDEACLFMGEGTPRLVSEIEARPNAHALADPLGMSSGYWVAEWSAPRFEAGRTDDVDALIPAYHHKFQGIA